jgi:hypothetical protein
MTEPTLAFSRLDQLGAIRVGGKDARAFLHSQLTQDIAQLAPEQATLAAWLDARGRVRALFELVPQESSYLLLTPADRLEALVGELQRYVLRADVALSADRDTVCAALIGDSGPFLAERQLPLGDSAQSLLWQADTAWIRLMPDLVLCGAPADTIGELSAALPPASPHAFARHIIDAGLSCVPSALAEKFIPQMLNLDRLGAVSFDKGCYPGQEVVARTHNLGSVKRRLHRFSAGAGPLPAIGSDVCDAAGSKTGTVTAAADTEGGIVLLAVTQIDQIDAGLRLADDGRTLKSLSLPYDLH